MEALLSWQTLMFMLGVFVTTYVVRKTAEGVRPRLLQTKLWEDTALPILPILLGAAGGFLDKTFPFPDGLADVWARVRFGAVCGFMSAHTFSIINALLAQRGVQVPVVEQLAAEEKKP